MKNYLKLVNDERQDKNVLSRKGCTPNGDECYYDQGTGCTYVDSCDVDYYSCTGTQYDVCGVDTCSDCNSTIADA